MKLLFITPKYNYGGAERQMSILMNFLAEKGMDITLLDLESKEKIDPGFKVEQFRVNFLDLNKPILLRLLGRIKTYVKISKFIKSSDYDYVIFFNLNFLPLVYLNKRKIIYSVREYNPKIFDSKIISFFLKRLFLITTNNLPSYILLERKYGNVLLQNNVINFDKVNGYKEKKGNKSYLIVSNFSERKNILSVVEAFISLKDQGYSLRIAGGIENRKYYDQVKELIERKGENIKVLGFLTPNELEEEYLKSKGIIHLSRLEGTPNALLDAVRYRKKFIALETPENLSLFSSIKEFLIDDVQKLPKKIKEIEEKDFSENLDLLYKNFEIIFNRNNLIKFYNAINKKGE